MHAMTVGRHGVISPLLDTASAVPAHCGDRPRYVTRPSQAVSNDNREPGVSVGGIPRESTLYPRSAQPPIDPPEDEDELPDDSEDDMDEHDEDFDQEFDRAAAYNDYCRDLEA